MKRAETKRGSDEFTGTQTRNYSSGDVSYVRRKRGRIHQEEDPSESGELNIVPYLDVIINLIMFLLVGQAAMVALGMIDVTAPSYAQAIPGDSAGPTEANKALRLTVGVSQQGFYIAARGGVLPGQTEEGPAEVTTEGIQKSSPTIPKLADGNYNFKELSRQMRGIKKAYPDTTAVYVAADDSVPYRTIVQTLDATRQHGTELLFPNVAFTQIR